LCHVACPVSLPGQFSQISFKIRFQISDLVQI
jgi:hypothetical protein